MNNSRNIKNYQFVGFCFYLRWGKDYLSVCMRVHVCVSCCVFRLSMLFIYILIVSFDGLYQN